MLAASINADMAPSSADLGQVGSNMLAALTKTLQGIESVELNVLTHTPLGRIVELAVSRFDWIVGEAENAFDTMVDALAPLFIGVQGAAGSQASQSPDSDILITPASGPKIGDPSISAVEGVNWYGVVASIGDNDSDGVNGAEPIQGTINWGDGNSSPFGVQVPEGGNANLYANHTWTEAGAYTVTITANDSDGGQNQVQETANVADGQLSWYEPIGGEPPPPSWSQTFAAAPNITTTANQTNTEADNVSLQIQASDPNGYTLSYSAIGLPPGLSINSSTGHISGTVDYSDAAESGGSYNPSIIVVDSGGGSAQSSFSWTINEAQVAPVLTNPGNRSNLRGDNVSLQLNASQVDNNPLTYTAANLPIGLSLDPTTGLISGTVDPSAMLNTPYAVIVTATDDATDLSANQNFNWTINAANVAPVLTSPGNQINSAGDDVSVQLSATDADGDNLTYTARGLPPGLTIDPIAGTITGTLPNSAASSTPYSVGIAASDGNATSSQSFQWTVHAVSLQDPGDQSNLDGDSVSLQMTAGDANNATLTYSASGLPSGLSINSSTGLISSTIASNADANSPYAVTVTATDSNHDSVSQTFNWIVTRVSLNPVDDQENQEDTAVSLQLSAADNEAKPTYSATGLPPGLSINSTTGLISGTVGIGSYGSSPYQVMVTAADGSSNSSQSFVWTVTPRVALVNPGPQSNATGDSVSLQLSATSPGGTMSYSATGLPNGLIISSSTGRISGTIASGDASSTPYSVTVTANDGTSHSSQTFQWTISAINLVSPGDQTNNDGDAVSLSLTTGYHGSGKLSYSATGLPIGLSINSGTGQIAGTISGTADTNSPYSTTVTVTDGTNTSNQTFNWTVNLVVTVDAIDDQSNAAGDVVSLQVSASDSENKTLAYSTTGLSTGLSIGSTTGLISGTIAVGADSGSPYAVTVTATDSANNSAAQSFNWNVSHVSLVNPGPQANIDGAKVSLQMQGHDADGDSLSYTAGGLPSGLSINASSGLISGTIASNADASSPYFVTVTAKDTGGHSTAQTFLWTVSQAALSAPSDQTNTEGDNVSLQLQGTASIGTLSYSGSGLPAGLSLNATSGLISGAIAAGDALNGPYIVDASVSNGSVGVSQTFTWTVNPVVNLTQPDDQNNNEGNNVSLQMAATDSLHKTLTYSASGLPAGLSINSSTGLISGTISSGDAENGPYDAIVTASDGTYSSIASFNWFITHTDTTALTMTNPGKQVNASGDSVNLQINASDPDGIDALSYSTTALPDGLDIDPAAGVISGTVADDAVTAMPYPVTVTADDGNGQTISQTFNWIINPAPIVVQASPVNAVEGNDTGTITVATFTTPDMNSEAGDFMATVFWGDGTNDIASVSGSDGSFSVSDDHTYAEKGSYVVAVQINDTATGGSDTASSAATVADAPLNMTGGFEYGDALTNPQGGYLLAVFTDGNPNAPISDYSASITWGDGGKSSGNLVESLGDGVYAVDAEHSYTNNYPNTVDPQTFMVTVTVTDVDGASAQVSDTIKVGVLQADTPAKLGNWGFLDQNTDATPSDFVVGSQTGVAEINWGDGSSSPGTVTDSNGGFNITATHTYPDSMDQPNGQDNIAPTVTDDDGNSLTGTQVVSIVRPPVTAYSVTLPDSLTLTNVQVAAFTDADDIDGSSEYSASINWGDGTSSSGTIEQVGPGSFQVFGSHTYASPCYAPVIVYISQGWSAEEEAAVAVDPKPAPPMLFSLAFDKGYTLQRDSNFVPLFAPQWLDEDLDGKIGVNDQQKPYAAVSGKNMDITAVFMPKGENSPAKTIEVKAFATYFGIANVNQYLNPVTLTLNKGKYTLQGTLPLPKYTERADLSIRFYYSTDNGKTWESAGTSSNIIYITYKPMTIAGAQYVTKTLQTVFAYATNGIYNPDTSLQNLLNHIWNNFSSRTATRTEDGQALTYYKNWKTRYTKYYELVSRKDGQCGSWAGLLLAAMLADGLDSAPGWTIKYDWIVPKQGSVFNGFLVNKWSFAPGGVNVNYLSSPGGIGTHSYNWVPGTFVQAKYLYDGIPGQNEANPASYFKNHQVIEVDMPAGVYLFDPSYGKSYFTATPANATPAQITEALNTDLQAFQNAAIAGFYESVHEVVLGVNADKLSITPNGAGDPLQLQVNVTNTFRP